MIGSILLFLEFYKPTMKPILKLLIKSIFILSTIFQLSISLKAQEFVIKGKVTDAETGEGMPFVNVFFQHDKSIGATTDFDGYYTIQTNQVGDSITASFTGYISRTKFFDVNQQEQNINFQLSSLLQKLETVEIVAGENPAHPIMRNVLAHKKQNDKRNIGYYEYENYSKVEVAVDNISDKFANRKDVGKVLQAIDSIGKITGEDGKALIPIFFSETISQYYYKKNPRRIKENIVKTRVNGVALTEGDFVSQTIGSTFQDYNFYKNVITVTGKDFVSPLADGWRLYYEYYLEDSLYIGDRWCYRIDVYPKQSKDLLFQGSIWIDSETYGLKQIDIAVGKEANLNFIEKIKIQQEMEFVQEGVWLPKKTRVLVDITQLTKNSAGALLKFYLSSDNFNLTKDYPLKFYDDPITVEETSKIYDDNYWQQHRHDSLSTEELKTYAMIDTIRQIPVVKTYVELITVLATGYKKLGPVDVGNYLLAYAWNDVEGHRVRLALRTNEDFSNKFILDGYAAYGTLDQQFKYGAGLTYIVSRKPWTEINIRRTQDIAQMALPNEIDPQPLLEASIRFLNVKDRFPYLRRENNFSIKSEIIKGVTQTIEFNNFSAEMLPSNPFSYYVNPEQGAESPTERNFNNTQISFETRLAKKERLIQGALKRYSLGTKYPVITLRYTMGLSDVLEGDFDYHKFYVSIQQDIKLGFFGTSSYQISGGFTPSQLPFPLLYVHLGNESLFYNYNSYNLMQFREFVSDTYASLHYEHHFNGFIFNRIPLLRKLKLRSFVGLDMIYGTLHGQNLRTSPFQENDFPIINSFRENTPYMEVNYGIENIGIGVLRFFRIHFVHRVNYLDVPESDSFGIRFSAGFNL